MGRSWKFMKSSLDKYKIKAVIVVGARPNFMKAAPVLRAMKKAGNFAPTLIHTGQHYDAAMSDAFFRDLEMPAPDVFLGVGSGSHAEQTAKVMLALEGHLRTIQPHVVVVVGDVNSTIAAALTARKMDIPVAHVEAGLRSFDPRMPEEVNRVLTDHISEFLFITEASARKNLLREGIARDKIYFVGNTMIDSLLAAKSKIAASSILKKLNLKRKGYAVATLHRPANVDQKKNLGEILAMLGELCKKIPIVLPLHPRTKNKIKEFGLEKDAARLQNLRFLEPMGYVDFIKLASKAKFVLTDSGGIQEETTVLGIPCLTLRKSTERPITATAGTNKVAGEDPKKALPIIEETLTKRAKRGRIPRLWDGHASERIVRVLAKKFHG